MKHEPQSDHRASVESAPPTRLILIRHAETEANVQQRWYGALDAPLTERGRVEVAAAAEAVAALAQRYPPDVFYVSPLPRAQATAAPIADAIDMQPVVEKQLREFDLGDWEGRTFQDLRETEDLWGRWAADPTFAPPNGESPALFTQRVQTALESLVDRHRGQTVLIVSHGAFIANALTRWLGDGVDWRRWDPPHCAITVLERDGKGEAGDLAWKPVLVNDVSHLPADSSTDPQEEPPA